MKFTHLNIILNYMIELQEGLAWLTVEISQMFLLLLLLYQFWGLNLIYSYNTALKEYVVHLNLSRYLI